MSAPHEQTTRISDDDRSDVTLLAFAETILCHLANRTKAKSRRHNQLLAAIERIERVDETYHGYMPESYKEDAMKTLEGIEKQLLGLYGREDQAS